jgi:hypothetical protein
MLLMRLMRLLLLLAAAGSTIFNCCLWQGPVRAVHSCESYHLAADQTSRLGQPPRAHVFVPDSDCRLIELFGFLLFTENLQLR